MKKVFSALVVLFVKYVDCCTVDQRLRPKEEFAVPVGDARVVVKGQFQFNCSHFLKNLNCCFIKVSCCCVIRFVFDYDAKLHRIIDSV